MADTLSRPRRRWWQYSLRFAIESDNMHTGFRIHWPVRDAVLVETREAARLISR